MKILKLIIVHYEYRPMSENLSNLCAPKNTSKNVGDFTNAKQIDFRGNNKIF